MDEGYVKVYRKLLCNPIVMKDTEHIAVWLYLILTATHKNKKALFGNEEIILKCGELITSRGTLATELKIKESKVERILKTFENAQQIGQQTNSQGRLISIKKWSMYQNVSNDSNNKRTTREQQVDTNNNERMEECNGNSKEEINKEEIIGIPNTVVGVEEVNNEESDYSLFENFFGRPLSSTEIMFIDSFKYQIDIIKYALDEARLANKISIKYVNGILENWKNVGVKSVEDAKRYVADFKKNKEKKNKKMDLSTKMESYYKEL